jgi:threonylcarbamoyladenosine tRNA methylthiotransferase MtaB
VNRIAFHTLGCKLNYAETSSIAQGFLKKGYALTGFSEEAEIYVIHSCTVTSQAERKCIAAVRRAKKMNPAATIAVIGCMADTNAERLTREEGVSIILRNSEKFSLYERIHGINTTLTEDTSTAFVPSHSEGGRTRTFFKIQDGCDYFCSYCSIPFARGRSRSLSVTETILGIKKIAESCSELVLTGVNIGDFGRKNGETLKDLLVEIEKIDEIKRVRLSSVEPDLLVSEIIQLVKDSGKFMPHFHIPLQSGSDAILKSMGRRYNTDFFKGKTEEVLSLLPHACIATDVITGFPGETSELFYDTLHYLQRLEISYMHVFTYSERPGTKALSKGENVPAAEKSERSRLLHQLSEEKKISFYIKNEGMLRDVLVEDRPGRHFAEGFTENYIRVRLPWSDNIQNKILRVRLEVTDSEDYMNASIINQQ